MSAAGSIDTIRGFPGGEQLVLGRQFDQLKRLRREDQAGAMISVATISFVGGTAAILNPSLVTGTAAGITFSGQQATITHAAPASVTGTTATWAWSGQQATIAHFVGTTVTGAAATIQFVGGTASILNPILVSGSVATITFTGLTATLAQAVQVAGTAAEWAWAGQTATISQSEGIGGSLIRRRRTKTPYWDEDEALAELLQVLGKHPPERTRRELRSAAKSGLTELLVSGEPVETRYARKDAVARFSYPVVARQYLDVYQTATKSKNLVR